MARLLGSLDCVVLSAPDVAALVAAYCAVLDAAPIEEDYPHWSRIRLANVDVGIRQAEAPPVPSVTPVFRVHDIRALRGHLEASEFTLVDGFEAVPGGVRCTFRDPAGNQLAAVQWGARLEELERP